MASIADVLIPILFASSVNAQGYGGGSSGMSSGSYGSSSGGGGGGGYGSSSGGGVGSRPTSSGGYGGPVGMRPSGGGTTIIKVLKVMSPIQPIVPAAPTGGYGQQQQAIPQRPTSGMAPIGGDMCGDYYPRLCAAWAYGGFCTKNKDFMDEYCELSCGNCDKDGKNSSSSEKDDLLDKILPLLLLQALAGGGGAGGAQPGPTATPTQPAAGR